jgi:hypothetical protein
LDLRQLLRSLFDPWLILGALGFGVALSIATLLLLWFTRPSQTDQNVPSAAITVIARSTATPIIPTATPTLTPTATPPPLDLPLPPPGDISIDAYVQVTGTGGDGLRLRTGPGLDREVRLLGLEDEVFLVEDGPQSVDGFSWWFIRGLFDDSRRGWAVANYLRVVQNP